MTDIELKREQAIEYAEYYKNYELSLTKHQYDYETRIIQDEYENERLNLHDMVLQSIEEKKKQIKEEREDAIENFDIKDLFRDAYLKVKNKRNLRSKRSAAAAAASSAASALAASGGGGNERSDRERNASASPSSRHNELGTSRRRGQNRQSTPYNIHSSPSNAEEEELESEFINMKVSFG